MLPAAPAIPGYYRRFATTLCTLLHARRSPHIFGSGVDVGAVPQHHRVTSYRTTWLGLLRFATVPTCLPFSPTTTFWTLNDMIYLPGRRTPHCCNPISIPHLPTPA